ncbi:ADP-ribosylglycohydrolase family protein [Rhizobium sp. L1K21]|uniref:ADP-ribosylglycohydrolase family protein n=1 Tax=Rhizobium sp. L1K21 TaxID=2954933 RepID=UPI002092410B|nr:ADP-ribosylglycohydrolase family protein [Rhizobium sp. L1K21]MCO6187617.1 ADP-ribosylglycohydrolase family protein [Rhizobium sp. L1K21]
METSKDTIIDHALAALAGGALGDALGMPTQLLSPKQIAESYGNVDDFVAPTEDHPVSKGLPPGAITDDTEQTLLLGSVLLDSSGGFDHALWIKALVDWEEDIRARGGYDLLGPSTKRAIDAINRGVAPGEAGRYGDTNGAAMRVAPVGIMLPPTQELIAMVAETCRSTHNTTIAISAAVAVATMVSCGVAGMKWRDAIPVALDACRTAESEGSWVAGGRVSARIAWALSLAEKATSSAERRALFDLVGTSVASQESVPAAFAVLALADGNCWQAAVIAANLGGDTDTIGAIACSMAGACGGYESLPADKIGKLVGFDLNKAKNLATALADRRLSHMRAHEVRDG